MIGRSRKPMTSGVGVTYEADNCQTCTDPTKYPIGFWDSKNSHGQIFDCNNQACLVKQENNEKIFAIKAEKATNIIENVKIGISMERVKMQRKSLNITIAKMAKELGISPSTYSGYEQHREALPVELRDRIEGVFNSIYTNFSSNPKDLTEEERDYIKTLTEKRKRKDIKHD